MKKHISDKDLDNVLESYAKENSGKYGSDEQMFADLKQHFAAEKAAKKAKSSPFTLRRMLVSAGALSLALIVTLSSLWYFVWRGDNTVHDDIEYANITRISKEQLITTVGSGIVMPTIDNYDIIQCNKFEDKGNLIAYNIKYAPSDESPLNIILTVILTDKSTTMESRFIETNIAIYNTVTVRKVYEGNSNGICNFTYSDKVFYIDFTGNADMMEEIYKLIII